MKSTHSSAVKPFAEDASSTDIAGLTVENGTEAITAYGQLRIGRDKAGLEQARALAAFFTQVVHTLETAADLPEQVATTGQVTKAPAPFG